MVSYCFVQCICIQDRLLLQVETRIVKLSCLHVWPCSVIIQLVIFVESHALYCATVMYT